MGKEDLDARKADGRTKSDVTSGSSIPADDDDDDEYHLRQNIFFLSTTK